MKLIIGLGNPGSEYVDTRHNIGYQLLDVIAKNKNIVFDKKKYNALYTEYRHNDEKILLVKPLLYMNLSGVVVKKFVDYFKVSLDNLLVIHDDLDMSFGRIKFVYNSNDGGHNGIKDIEKQLASKSYLRLKIGISNDKSIDTKNYVLGKFSKDEKEKLDLIYDSLKYVSDDFCDLSYEQLMSKYNKK